jgi:hypothetical protein
VYEREKNRGKEGKSEGERVLALGGEVGKGIERKRGREREM